MLLQSHTGNSDTILGADKHVVGRSTAHTDKVTGPSRRPRTPIPLLQVDASIVPDRGLCYGHDPAFRATPPHAVM